MSSIFNLEKITEVEGYDIYIENFGQGENRKMK